MWRRAKKGEGPRHVEEGGKVLYFRSDIEGIYRGDPSGFGAGVVVVDDAALAARRAAIKEQKPVPLAPAPARASRRGRPTKAEQRARLTLA